MYGKTNSVVIKADLPTDTLSIVQNGEYDVLNYAKASVNVPGKEEQSKSLDITENKVTTIHPDNGKVLKEVVVTTNIPSIPQQEKTIEITENGTTTVTPDTGKVLSKVSITTNVSQTPEPAKGVIFSDYDNDGYPHTATIKDMFDDVVGNNVIKGMLGITSNELNEIYPAPYLGKLEKIVLNSTKPITGFRSRCFMNLARLKELVCINGYDTSIVYGEFSFNNTGFESLTLSNVSKIDEGVFYNCKNLKTVNFINCGDILKVQNIFNGCEALTNIELPNTITLIGPYVFFGCTSLINLTIPASVANIKEYALQIGSSTNKATITFKSTTPPTITTSTFDKAKLNKIYVPSASVEAYKTATNWTTFAGYIEANPNE